VADLETLFAAVDEANSDDPNEFEGDPLALAQGRMAEAWVTRLDLAASDGLRLAARAHHLRRWVVPRDSYPSGREGYLRWRRDQKLRHGEELCDLLLAVDTDEELIERACAIVQKKGLGSDAEVQAFEDAVSLTFMETQLTTTTGKVADDDRMVDVVAKTLRKMSPAGHAEAATIPLDPPSALILQRAIDLVTD
jgi:hypothetical protein